MISLYFTLFCILHLWILALFLISMQNNRGANRFLALFLVLFSTIHLQHLALQTGFLLSFPYIDPVCGITICLAFPVFLFYVKSMTGTFDWKNKKNLWHLFPLIPAVINLLYLIIFKNAVDLKEYYYQKDFKFTLVNALLLAGMTLLLLFYVVLSLQELKDYEKRLKNNFSSVEKVKLDWLKQLIVLLIVLAVLVAPVLIIIGLPEWNRVGMGIYTSLIYLSMMYKTFNQSSVVPEFIEADADKVAPSLTFNKEELLTKVQEFISANKPYLNPDLTIKQLANDMGIQAHLLSYLINNAYGMNFFDFINSMRIEEAKQLFKSPTTQNWTIEAIGLESGFGSKSAFNRSFKEITGQTPSQFRKTRLTPDMAVEI